MKKKSKKEILIDLCGCRWDIGLETIGRKHRKDCPNK